MCTAFQYHPRTAKGVHCPTAVVQVVEVVTKRTCCNKVAHVERKPKPGDAAFVQCRCAEKKDLSHQAVVPPKLEPFFLPEYRLELPTPPQPEAVTYTYSAALTPIYRDPDERPPVNA